MFEIDNDLVVVIANLFNIDFHKNHTFDYLLEELSKYFSSNKRLLLLHPELHNQLSRCLS